MIEGVYAEGDRCLVVEDIVTSGKSVLEAVEKLRTANLNITDTVVVIDREQGGKQLLEKSGIKLHSVTTISHLLDVLVSNKKIDHSKAQEVKATASLASGSLYVTRARARLVGRSVGDTGAGVVGRKPAQVYETRRKFADFV